MMMTTIVSMLALAVYSWRCLYSLVCYFVAGDEEAHEMSGEADRDRGWLGKHCDTVCDVSPPQSGVNVDERQPEAEDETISGSVLNGRSPTSPNGECPQPLTTAPGTTTTTFVADVKDSWSPGAASNRGSWESVASDCLSDAWSSATSGLEDNRVEGLDVEKDRHQPEVTDARTIVVVSDSSPTPPPPNLVASSEPPKDAVLSPRSTAATAVSTTDESVVRKLESFVESMNVRRCVKPTAISLTDAVTLSSTSGLGRQSFPVSRPLPPLNGLRGSGSGVLLPFYVPFKTSDMVDHPLDLSSKTNPVGRTTSTKTGSTAAFVQAKDETSEMCGEGVSSLESLQKQFGENSAMLERIGVRRHTVSGVAPLAGVGARMHGPASPLNGVGLYGPALNEPCIPLSCRPVPVPQSDDPAAVGMCAPTSFDDARSLAADRRSSRRLVRGQDAWMNGVCGRQRRSSVLRCLECNMSFWSLPELTLHMIKTAHYANIVRTSVVPAPTPEMTSSPTMTSSCSPVDSDSSRESEVDNDRYFRQAAGGCSDFRLAKSAKRAHESSSNDDDCSKRSKIWRPDCPLSTGHCSTTAERPAFHATSTDGRVSPICGDMDGRHPSGLVHDGTVTSSKLPEGREGAMPLYDRSPGRSEDASDDGEATRQPALTAMEDFISRSICELDRGKRRPAVPLLPPPALPPRLPQPANGLPPSMTVADLMFPLFPLAQFFPEQFLIASRAFNFLPLVQSLARLYGDRLAGLDIPLGAPGEFPVHKTADDFDATRRPARQRTPVGVGKSSDRKEDSSKCQRVNGGEYEAKSRSRDCRESESLRSTSDSDGLRGLPRDADDRQKLSPTSSDLIGDGLPSTALDSLRGFVYGDRKRTEHARAERKYSREQREGHLPRLGGSTGQDVDEAVRRLPGQSPSISSGADSVPGTSSPAADFRADAPEGATLCGGIGRTTDYDSRFDKYYRLARELAGQL